MKKPQRLWAVVDKDGFVGSCFHHRDDAVLDAEAYGERLVRVEVRVVPVKPKRKAKKVRK